MLPRHRRAHSIIKAFTLVELLLALIIFAIIAVSLYSMFSNGLKVHVRAQDIGKTYRQLGLAYDLLENDLQKAINYDFSGSYPDKKSFTGEPNRLQMMVPEDGNLWVIEYFLGRPQSGKVHKTIVGGHVKSPKEVIVSADEDKSTWFLMRKRTPFPSFLAQSDQGSDEEVIISGLIKDGFALAFGVVSQDPNNLQLVGKVLYKESWVDAGLPQIVKVNVSIDADGDGKVLQLSRVFDLPIGGK